MPIELWNLLFAALGFIAAIVAAWYAIRAYALKTGVSVRGSYGTTSTVDCEGPFVSSVTLENMKDRAVVVFGIWFDLGPGYYLELERFDDAPLIIEPFQVVHRTYDPIQHYSSGTDRVTLTELFPKRDLRRRLLISTPSGRYRVRTWIRRWEPIHDWLNNYTTGMFYPVRYTVDGKAYGSNILYLAKLRLPDGKTEAIPFREGDHELKRFKHFQLTKESLASASNLQTFLLEQALAGHIKCLDLEVIDLQASRKEVFEEISKPPVILQPRSPVVYHVLGRLYTFWENLRINRANRKARAAESATRRKPAKSGTS